MNGKPRTVRLPALTDRAIDVAREAYRDAVAQMQRLARRDHAQEPAATELAATELAATQPESVDTDLAQERVRIHELEQQLAARTDQQKLLAQELARNEELEQRLAARPDERKLLAEERARIQELEQQLAARGDEQKLLVQERARHHALEQQLATHGDEQKLLEQKRARNRELALQLSIRQNDEKLVARERARRRELEQRLATLGDEQGVQRTDQRIGKGGGEPVAPPGSAAAPLPPAPRPLWQYKSRIAAVSGALLLLFAGAAGYAVFSSPSPEPGASQTAAQAVAPPARAIPVAADLVRVSARPAGETDFRDALAQRQADEQRLADTAAAKAPKEEARPGADSEEADLRLTSRDRQKLQAALTELGFDVGKIDGLFGARTRQMIGAWQDKIGDISTGFLTAAQKKALLSQGAFAVARWEDEQKRTADEKQRRAIAVQYLPPPDGSGPLVAGKTTPRN